MGSAWPIYTDVKNRGNFAIYMAKGAGAKPYMTKLIFPNTLLFQSDTTFLAEGRLLWNFHKYEENILFRGNFP
jgi:hypothetical protein